MRGAGYTLMLVEQNATRALAIADRAYVLELGRNRFEAGPATPRRPRGQAPVPGWLGLGGVSARLRLRQDRRASIAFRARTRSARASTLSAPDTPRSWWEKESTAARSLVIRAGQSGAVVRPSG